MKIISKEKSKLLPRIDVVAMVTHFDKRTPSGLEVKEELVKDLKVDKELILVKHIYSDFGTGRSKIIAHVYNNKEDMERIIKKGKKQKEAETKAAEEAKKKSEEKVAATKEEPAKVEDVPKEKVENGEEKKEEQTNK
ncbi:hypothetical protein K8R33_02205 [archaeon]|nr:hypothetical protein [archaeon]